MNGGSELSIKFVVGPGAPLVNTQDIFSLQFDNEVIDSA